MEHDPWTRTASELQHSAPVYEDLETLLIQCNIVLVVMVRGSGTTFLKTAARFHAETRSGRRCRARIALLTHTCEAFANLRCQCASMKIRNSSTRTQAPGTYMACQFSTIAWHGILLAILHGVVYCMAWYLACHGHGRRDNERSSSPNLNRNPRMTSC